MGCLRMSGARVWSRMDNMLTCVDAILDTLSLLARLLHGLYQAQREGEGLLPCWIGLEGSHNPLAILVLPGLGRGRCGS